MATYQFVYAFKTHNRLPLCQTCFKRFLSSVSLYERLGVSPTATQAEIKHAYIKLSKIYHPDAQTPQSSSEKFAELNAAYEVLGRSDRRRQYDSERLWSSATSASSTSASSGTASSSKGGGGFSQAGGRRDAGPIDDFSERMRHEAEWMYMASARHSRRRQGSPGDASKDQQDHENDVFKVKIVAALVGAIVVGALVRASIAAFIQSSQHRREQAEYEQALSILSQQQQGGSAVVRHHRQQLMEDIEARLRAKYSPPAAASTGGGRGRSQAATAEEAEDARLEELVSSGGVGYDPIPKSMSPRQVQDMHQRRLENFRRVAERWSPETRAELRPRLSPELAAELDRLAVVKEAPAKGPTASVLQQ